MALESSQSYSAPLSHGGTSGSSVPALPSSSPARAVSQSASDHGSDNGSDDVSDDGSCKSSNCLLVTIYQPGCSYI